MVKVSPGRFLSWPVIYLPIYKFCQTDLLISYVVSIPHVHILLVGKVCLKDRLLLTVFFSETDNERAEAQVDLARAWSVFCWYSGDILSINYLVVSYIANLDGSCLWLKSWTCMYNTSRWYHRSKKTSGPRVLVERTITVSVIYLIFFFLTLSSSQRHFLNVYRTFYICKDMISHPSGIWKCIFHLAVFTKHRSFSVWTTFSLNIFPFVTR